MDNHSDGKANASRRRFAKSIISAAAALPLVSVLTNAQSQRGRRRGTQRTDARPQPTPQKLGRILDEHDTPPPVLIMQGSCIFEVAAANDSIGSPDDSGNRRKYRITPKNVSGNIFFEHVKIIDGSGEMLFRFDNDRLLQPVEVLLTLTDDKELRLSAEGSKLLIDLEKTRKFKMKAGDPSMSAEMSLVKRARFRYMDNASNAETDDIKFVRVFIGGVKVFDLALDDLRSRGEELKIMLWWKRRP